jgi:uncharacterized nucleotidyltransferase DUF6036
MTTLSRADIIRALNALSAELQSQGARYELVIFGGAALVLVYGARQATKDVDGIVLGRADAAVLRSAAKAVATSLGLPSDWLNDGAKGYVHGIAIGATILDTASLAVRAAAPEQLLAMKLCAWRDDIDIEDARLVLHSLSGDRENIWSRVEPFLVPGRELKARYAFDDLWEGLGGPR